MIEVVLPFLRSSMKEKFRKILLIFDIEMTLKIRIVLYLTFDTKSKQICMYFLPYFYGFFHRPCFGLVYSQVNSAMLSFSSEVTLTWRFSNH